MKSKDPRVKKTLRDIDRALIEGLKNNTLQKITVDYLCREAEINRTTFYKYYTDKYNLFNNYIERILSDFKEAMDASFILASPDDVGSIKYQTIFHRCISYIESKQEAFQVLWNAQIEVNVYKEMVYIVKNNMIEERHRMKAYNEDVAKYVDLYSELFASNMLTMIKWWFDHHNTVSIDEVQKIMTMNMSQGLFTAFTGLIDLGKLPS